MPCKEYEQLEYQKKMEREKYAHLTRPENEHLLGVVGDRKAKFLAREAKAKAIQIGKQMYWHREHCEECKKKPHR